MNMLGYLLWSYEIYTDDDFSEEEAPQMHSFPYIFMLEKENEYMNRWVEENYPEQLGRDVIVTDLRKVFK